MSAVKLRFVLTLLLALFLIQSPSEAAESKLDSKHIVLVHGACLGAWSWYKLIPLLESNGYKVTALDLAASGVDPRQVTDIPFAADYTKPLTEFMSSLPSQERVMLVGHSFGGVAISQSMELFPHKIFVAVFLTAIMPGPTYPILEVFLNPFLTQIFVARDNALSFGDGIPDPTFLFGPQYARTMLSPLSSVEDSVVVTKLMRKLRIYNVIDLSKVYNLTHKKYGSVKRVFIKSGRDQALLPSVQNLMIEKNPPTAVEEISTSDHMVMMSRTQELSDRLSQIAQSYQ